MAPPQWAFQVEYFDPPPDEELVCSICRAVFCEPVQCPCHHVFCRQCISKWLQENYSCPVCRKRAANRLLEEVVPIVKNMIMKLTLHCHNFEHGCLDKLTLEGCETHVKNCKYEIVQCKNKPCKKKCFRKDVMEHETNDCAHRNVKCNTCNLKISTVKHPVRHSCVKELILALKKKKATLKQHKLKIKNLEEEIKKLKQKERDRENIYSDSSFGVDIFSSESDSDLTSTNSESDYVLNWTPSASDISLEFEGSISDIDDDGEINIEIERTPNDSIIVLNSTIESSGGNNTSDCLEVPRANSSNIASSSTSISHNTSDILDASDSFEEDQPRRPNKRRLTFSQFLSSDASENEDWLPSVSTWFKPASVKVSQDANAADQNLASSSTGQSSSSTCSSSVPSRKDSLGKRKKYRRHSTEESSKCNDLPLAEGVDLNEGPIPDNRRTFEKTLTMLEKYSLESDPEWFPPPELDDDSTDLSDYNGYDSSLSVSLEDDNEEDNEDSDAYITYNVPTAVLLQRSMAEEDSDEDPEWQEDNDMV